MHIIQHGQPQPSDEPGVRRLHVAGHGVGIFTFESWRLTLAPHASSEGRRDELGEHVLVVISGLGKLLLAGAPQRFVAPCTLVLPPLADYRIVNQGAEPLELLSICTHATPKESP